MSAGRETPAASERPRMSRRLRREQVTKPDGRYLIYYAWTPAEQTDDQGDVRRTAAEKPDV